MFEHIKLTEVFNEQIFELNFIYLKEMKECIQKAYLLACAPLFRLLYIVYIAYITL